MPISMKAMTAESITEFAERMIAVATAGQEEVVGEHNGTIVKADYRSLRRDVVRDWNRLRYGGKT